MNKGSLKFFKTLKKLDAILLPLCKMFIWLVTCVISFGIIVGVIAFFNFDLGEKHRCLDSNSCAEGLSLNTEHGLMYINEENCLKYGYEWFEGARICDLNDREEERAQEETIQEEKKGIEAKNSESAWGYITVFSVILFFLLLPFFLILSYMRMISKEGLRGFWKKLWGK